MDDLLPSYADATRRDAWALVARYLQAKELANASLVCKKWYRAFTQRLWECLAEGYSLTRFLRALPHTRRSVREFTHTLYLSPSCTDRYENVVVDWLWACLNYLPNLRCLIVHGAPYFDHAALLRIRHSCTQSPTDVQVFRLRLFDLKNCENATSAGLAEMISRSSELVYLDLSWTLGGKGDAVLRGLRDLRQLRVLRLRGMGLKDAEFEGVARAVGRRVRSLDLRGNALTDASLGILMEFCVKEEGGRREALAIQDGCMGDNLDPDAFGAASLECHVRNKLTGGFSGCLAIEEVGDAGVTHLYLSGNHMTVKGISRLLRSGRMHVLDIGMLTTAGRPSVEKADGDSEGSSLVPLLAECASATLRYLRVDYRVVTEVAPAVRTDSSDCPSGVRKQSPVSGHNPESEIQQSSMHAPEARGGEATNAFTRNMESITPSMSTNLLYTSRHSSPSTNHEITTLTTQLPTRPRHYPTHYAEDRRSRQSIHYSQQTCLHPGMLPRLQTLVLTNVPCLTSNQAIHSRIIKYIKHAAHEASLARQHAKRAYALPPGRDRTLAEQEHAHTIFALRRIVLEMSSPQTTTKGLDSKTAQPMKSVTEDADSEALWEAYEHDFSFFGNEDKCARGIAEQAVLSGNSTLNSRLRELDQSFDIVAEVGRFRREMKAVYDRVVAMEGADGEVEGYWPGDITVVRKTLDE